MQVRLLPISLHWIFLLAVEFLFLGCRSQPRWLDDFRTILQETNHELESLLPQLASDASLSVAYVGLLNLEKAAAHIATETERVFRTYPEINKEKNLIEKYLALDFKRLAANVRKIIESVGYWKVKLKHSKEFSAVIERLEKKVKEINDKTRPR